jgi:hypothetical protein
MEKLVEVSNFVDWRNKNKVWVVTFRIEHNTASIYSNDLELLITLSVTFGEVTVKITEVQLEQFAGTKYYVNKLHITTGFT